ncbi:MAG: hypothetical protein PVSMB4_08210 [Ktedonobacterales bacterium]
MRRFMPFQRSSRVVLVIVALATSILLACNLPTVPQGPSNVSAEIKAAQGGTLSNNRATLTIPANALAADATVTLSDTGKHRHATGDPLDYISDAFSVNTKGTDGKPVLFKSPATLGIDSGADASKNAQDLIVAMINPATPQAIQLHHSLGGRLGQGGSNGTVSYKYSTLNSLMWVIRIPILTVPQPQEKEVLQVPWYNQSGLPWCVPTSLTEMLRYYDFTPDAGDPLNATFGSDNALANWEMAAQSHQPAGSGAGYDEMDHIGVPQIGDSSGTGYVLYLWDDDLAITASGAHGNFNDFEVYTILVNTGIFGLFDRKPLAMLVDNWWHSVVIVGVDGTNIYIHDSNGPIAEKIAWTDFQNQARSWRTDANGTRYEVHTIWTAVAYGYPIRPETMRRGSVVISRGDLTTNDNLGNQVSLEWDAATPHNSGYYLKDPASQSLILSSLGYYALRTVPLHYQYRIANVTNVPLTYTSVAEYSGPNYGDGLVSQVHTITVNPYTLSGYISGTFNEPSSGSSAVFDVKLFSAGTNSAVQDAKFIRLGVRDPLTPSVKVVLPANGAHVFAGSDVVFQASSYDPDTGGTLPGNELSWTANGTSLGGGGSITHTFDATGTYEIVLTGTTAGGGKASDSITIEVDPAPPAASAAIVSPANNAVYYNTNSTPYPVNLVASGSPGMQFSWSDNIDGSVGSGASITANLTVQNVGNCAPATKHVITLTGQDNLGRTATSQITIYLEPTCIK